MLSIVDIQNKEFKRNKIGGYNVDEVNDYLEQIIKSYQEILNENYALKDKVNVLGESVQYYRTMESTIQNVLVLADKTAQDTKAAAYEKSEQIKKEADQRAERIITLAEERVTRIMDQGRQEAYELAQRVEEGKSQYLAYKMQFKQLAQAQLEFLEQGDIRMGNIQEELSGAFLDIEQEVLGDDAVAITEEVAATTETSEEEFYTKAYVPLNNEEIESLLQK